MINIRRCRIHPREGDMWVPLYSCRGAVLSFPAWDVQLTPNGPAGIIEIGRIVGDRVDLEAWRDLRPRESHAVIVPEGVPISRAEDNYYPSALNIQLISELAQAGTHYIEIWSGVRGEFRSNGVFNSLSMEERHPVVAAPGYGWLYYCEEGDIVYLPKERCHAQLESGYRFVRGRHCSKVFLRRWGGRHIEKWYTDSRGRGFDGSTIILPTRGYLRGSDDDIRLSQMEFAPNLLDYILDWDAADVVNEIRLQRQWPSPAPAPPARSTRMVRIRKADES